MKVGELMRLLKDVDPTLEIELVGEYCAGPIEEVEIFTPEEYNPEVHNEGYKNGLVSLWMKND